MPVGALVESVVLLFVLLNPFLMSVYLLDLIQDLEAGVFRRVLARGAMIAGAVFAVFATAGDVIFRDVLQVRFASFLIFGGVVFLIVALRFVVSGADAIRGLRGGAQHLAGSVAMPFMIGPATVSASVVIGQRLPLPWALGTIALTMTLVVVSLIVLKKIHDYVVERNQQLVERYVEIVGRIMALFIGTLAVEMILQGIDQWRESISTAG